MAMSCKINPHILRYIQMVEDGEIPACQEQQLLVAHVRQCFETEDIYTDNEQLERYLGLAKYFPFERVFEWQGFVIGLHDCTYWANGLPRWPDMLCLIGRGAGKDGTIAWESLCLLSPYNGIRGYDVDICANNEEQAMRPLKDVLEALEEPKQIRKLRRHFYWNKEEITCLKTKSVLKGRTNSPKGKDGLRSGIAIFNEIHQYQNYDNINVFTTGLGKKKHPRRSYYTTNGDVRQGPLDDLLDTSNGILRGGEPDNGFLPFICKLDTNDEVHDPANWPKANPSLPYLPHLRQEIEKEYKEWSQSPGQLPAFMTKRMNIPQTNQEIAVTDWENIVATNTPLPSLDGWSCTAGIDYASLRDWASVNLHFRKGNRRFDISHSWVCAKSADLPKIKAPWQMWAQAGDVTVVDDVAIPPELLAQYLQSKAKRFNIVKVALDNYRFALLRECLQRVGFSFDRGNLHLVRPSDIMKVQPVIDNCFTNHLFCWGDYAPLRWATNNTKLVRSGRTTGTDTGNYYFAKIEGKSRKTDPFMALVASMAIEDTLGVGFDGDLPNLGVIV